MKNTFRAATALACLAVLTACTPEEEGPQDRAENTAETCSSEFTTKLYPELGMVRQQESCDREGIAGAFVQWDFQNTQQVCPGFSDWISVGGGVGIGSCKSLFDESVNQTQRDALLASLNEARSLRSLPAITLAPGQ